MSLFRLFVRRFSSATPTRVLFSGIQPTGILHLGNYFGAVNNWLRLQNCPETAAFLVSIVDYHAITTEIKPAEELRRQIFDLAATLLACGLDSERVVFFQQSRVPQHTELAWILSCMATIPSLKRLPQFKDKAAKYGKHADVPVALLTYPLLQTADILLYRATHIPVGEDQQQHLGIVRHLAYCFNCTHGQDFFPVPEQLLSETPRVKSLRDPFKKMSKSDVDGRSRVGVVDSPDDIREKLKKAMTDFDSRVTFEPNERPAVSNLVLLHSVVSGKTPEKICQEADGLTTAQYKLVLADEIIAKFAKTRERYLALRKDETFLCDTLKSGSEKAFSQAQQTLIAVKELIGVL